jgi:hypothetical protein
MIGAEIPIDKNKLIKNWWSERRWKYNRGLVIAGIVAFFLYAVLGGILIEPHDDTFEVTLFTTAFQGMGYLIMILVANVFYNLGPLLDRLLNKKNSEKFRTNLYNIGFWFSFGLPFLIPVLIIIQYFTLYYK